MPPLMLYLNGFINTKFTQFTLNISDARCTLAECPEITIFLLSALKFLEFLFIHNIALII